ncbi:hypothetical protein [Frankia sp. CiP3]|uniref:hypothetical protein n=1 Tax=Frankia sp. CiP3 TaxID=2880971 RepID=UPI0027E0532E|nr:hypothetical protein [Frankia sp. CiP3]
MRPLGRSPLVRAWPPARLALDRGGRCPRLRACLLPRPYGCLRGPDDSGTALIEFVGLSVLLLIPFVYFFLSVFSVQRSAFAVTQAARAAGRAYATADSEDQAVQRARVAARLAFADQGIDGAPEVRFAPEGADCGAGDPGDGAASLAPGARFVVCVRSVAALPGTARLFTGLADITVNGKFIVVVDAYRRDRTVA